MVSEKALDAIADALDLGAEDEVLEIGPGLGFLTERLAARAKRVIAVEKDKRFCAYLRECFAAMPNISIIESDILEFDFSSLRGPLACTGNLPYQISSPLLELLQAHRKLWSGAVFTFQKDFALRVIAKPGTEHRSSLSCWVQMHADAEIVRHFGKSSFFPAPKVDSSLLKLRYLETPRYGDADPGIVRACIRSAFQKKRKNILNSLSSSAELGLDKPAVEKALERAGVAPSARPEDLALDEWTRIARQIVLK